MRGGKTDSPHPKETACPKHTSTKVTGSPPPVLPHFTSPPNAQSGGGAEKIRVRHFGRPGFEPATLPSNARARPSDVGRVRGRSHDEVGGAEPLRLAPPGILARGEGERTAPAPQTNMAASRLLWRTGGGGTALGEGWGMIAGSRWAGAPAFGPGADGASAPRGVGVRRPDESEVSGAGFLGAYS